MDFTLMAGFFAGLISILNPVGMAPVFLDYVRTDSAEVQRAVALLMGISILGFLLVFFFLGGAVLGAFGITMPAFRIAGGVLIFTGGLGMMTGRNNFAEEGIETKSGGKNPFAQAGIRLSSIIVPVAMPLIVGPGAITTVILFHAQARGPANYAGMVLVIVSAAAIVTALLYSAGYVYKILGANGMQIVMRFMGLILCAMAVQFMIDGVSQLLPGVLNAVYVSPSSHQ